MKNLLKLPFLGVLLSIFSIIEGSSLKPLSSQKKTGKPAAQAQAQAQAPSNNVVVTINGNQFSLPDSLGISEGSYPKITLSEENNTQQGITKLLSTLSKFLSTGQVVSTNLLTIGVVQNSAASFIKNFSDLVDLLDIAVNLKIYKKNSDDNQNEVARDVLETLYIAASANSNYASRILAGKITFDDKKTAEINRIKQIQSHYSSVSSKVSTLIDMIVTSTLNGSSGQKLYLSPDGATAVLVDGSKATITHSFGNYEEHDQAFNSSINDVCFNHDNSYIVITSDSESALYLSDLKLAGSAFDDHIYKLSGGSECRFNNENILVVHDKKTSELNIYNVQESSNGVNVNQPTTIQNVKTWDFYDENTIVCTQKASSKDKKLNEKLTFIDINGSIDATVDAVGYEISEIKVTNDLENNDKFITLNVRHNNRDYTYIVKREIDYSNDKQSIKQHKVTSTGWVTNATYFSTSINNVKIASSSEGTFVAAIENNTLKLCQFNNSKFEKISIGKEIKGTNMRLYNVLQKHFALERQSGSDRSIIIIDPTDPDNETIYSKIQKYGINPNGQSVLTATKERTKLTTKINIGDRITSPSQGRTVLEDGSFDNSAFAVENNNVFAIRMLSDWNIIQIL